MIRINNINKDVALDMGATLGDNSYKIAIDDEYTFDILLHPEVILIAPSDSSSNLMILCDGKAYILPANSFYKIVI